MLKLKAEEDECVSSFYIRSTFIFSTRDLSVSSPAFFYSLGLDLLLLLAPFFYATFKNWLSLYLIRSVSYSTASFIEISDLPSTSLKRCSLLVCAKLSPSLFETARCISTCRRLQLPTRRMHVDESITARRSSRRLDK